MEGMVVTTKKPGSIVEVSVTNDEQGRYIFPENRLTPGEYTLSIRAVGYDISTPAKATRIAKWTSRESTGLSPRKRSVRRSPIWIRPGGVRC